MSLALSGADAGHLVATAGRSVAALGVTLTTDELSVLDPPTSRSPPPATDS